MQVENRRTENRLVTDVRIETANGLNICATLIAAVDADARNNRYLQSDSW